MSNDKEKQLENLRQARFKKLREFEELEDAVRFKEKKTIDELSNLQQRAYHLLSLYTGGAPEIQFGLNQVENIKNNLRDQFKNARQQINREREDYEYDYQIQKRKINEN